MLLNLSVLSSSSLGINHAYVPTEIPSLPNPDKEASRRVACEKGEGTFTAMVCEALRKAENSAHMYRHEELGECHRGKEGAGPPT